MGFKCCTNQCFISVALYFYFEGDPGTIEHILPDSYPDIWKEGFSEEEFDRNIYSLGNLTLLEPSKNYKEAAAKDFEQKRQIYKTSKYAITNKIDYGSRTPGTIKQRQSQLAKIAASVWKI